MAREVRNNFLVRAAGALFKYGLSVPEIRAMVLLLNRERYGQGRHPSGPLTVEELERLVCKNLQKWETIRKTLSRMASDWLVTKTPSGHYTLACEQQDLGWEDLTSTLMVG